MFTNHLKILFGQLCRHKLQALINILGMAVGIAGCMLISAYVLFELSYDRHYEHSGNIYRVSADYPTSDSATVSALVVPLMLEEFPQIEAAGRIYANTPGLITRDELSFYEYELRFADNAIFDVFNFEWLQGDPETALTEPNTVQ